MKERQNKEGYNDPTAYAAMRRIEKGEAMSNGTFDIRRGDIFSQGGDSYREAGHRGVE